VSGNVVGYKLVRPELQIGRTVLDFSLHPSHLNVLSAKEIIRSGISTARLLGAKFLHICVPSSEFWPDLLFGLGFSKVREYWAMQRKPSPIKPPNLSDNFVISSFETGDEQTLTSIQNAAFDGSWGFCPNTVEQIKYRLNPGRESNIGVTFLKYGSHTAGYCWPYIKEGTGPTTGIIGMIGISPEYRKQGLSEPLLLSGLAYLLSEGAGTIELEVDSTNSAAIRLYSSQGFMKISTSYWFELFL
jgi:mycothiol synthase